jgi:hypothetical protein
VEPEREISVSKDLERLPFLARITADARAMSYSESQPSYSEADTGFVQGSTLEAPILRHLQPSPIPVHASVTTEPSSYPRSITSNVGTETGTEKHRGREATMIERLESSSPVNLLTNGEDSAPPRNLSIADECTLELVTDLRRSSGKRYLPTEVQEPPPPNKSSPLQSVAPEVMEAGLELATDFPAPLAISTRYSFHPERVEPGSISVPSSIRSTGSNRKSKLGFFKRLGNSKNTSSTGATPPLPSNLQAYFSICGQSLFVWSKRDSSFIVRISDPFTSGQKVDLGAPWEPNNDAASDRNAFSIRMVAANSQFFAAYTCRKNVSHNAEQASADINDLQENIVYVVCVDGKQYSVLLGEGIPLATSLAISPEKGYIALGCGSSIIIYRIKDGQLRKEYQVGTQIDSSAGSIRFQRLNFSPDSKKLIAATQVSSHSADRQTVYVKIWERFGAEFRNGPVVEDVPLTVVRYHYFIWHKMRKTYSLLGLWWRFRPHLGISFRERNIADIPRSLVIETLPSHFISRQSLAQSSSQFS